MKKFLILTLLTTMVFACKDSPRQIPKVDPGFTNYISGFTSGVISVISNPRIRLIAKVPESTQEELMNETLIEFKPEIKGSLHWVNNVTLEFRPEGTLPPGTVYHARFHLYKLQEVPEHLKTIEFQFQTMQQAVFVNLEGLQSIDDADLQWQKLNGTLKTADYADMESVERVLQAIQSNKSLAISWSHGQDGRLHEFTIDSIFRSAENEEVRVKWNAREIGSKDEGEELVVIPSLGDFKLMNYQVIQQPDQYVSLWFSDPVNKKQDLRGLIYYESGESIKLEISGSQVKVYPASRLQGLHTLVIDRALSNSLDYSLTESYRHEITFTSINPDVELIGDGAVLPGGNGLLFPFKAVNLRAVNVRVIKIFEENVAQFLQVNQYDGNREMTRVGRIILNKEIPLTSDKPIDYGNWNIFSLDLSSLIDPESGAIYNVAITFNRSQSLYHCPGENAEAEELIPYQEDKEYEMYDGPDHYYYYDDYYYDNFNWQERDNPCSDSYYYYKQSYNELSRNVLASDLGIIAKGGSGNELLVAVTNLLSSEPMPGIQVEVYNYQNQIMAGRVTDNQGMVKIPLEKKPFLLVAKHGSQRGYLRLDDGSSLSTSMFDVSGTENVNGIKGFIYGERGVWRPGDSIYLTFVLEDKNNTLPGDHPVRFELYSPENQLYLKSVKTNHLNGVYDFRTSTEADAPTGNWLAKIIVGGSSFTKTLKIETVKPNRLKLSMDFGSDILRRGPVIGTLNAKWLHGAVARNLKADIELNLKSSRTIFREYGDYVFDDPVKSFNAEEELIFEGKLDSLGNARFSPDINVGNEAPGMLQASFRTRVFENSGDFSIDRFSTMYSPYKTYVGVKIPKGPGWNGALFSNEPNIIPIVTVDESGNTVDRNNLVIEIYDVRWRWWWERDDLDNLSSYVQNRSRNLIKTDMISTVNGKAMYEMKFDKDLWGRKLIRITDPQGGHSTGSTMYLSYKGWWNSAGQDNPGGAEMLTFTTDKKEYKAGEDIRVELPFFQEGRALVSIENGSRIISSFWVESPMRNPLIIKATGEMAPNAYLHITLIQPHKRTSNDLPIRLYGIQYVNVIDQGTILNPVLRMPDKIEPEQNVTLHVSEGKGRRMTYTVAVVDEGLLDLTRYDTPDIWSQFYAKEALGIRTWDMYKYVMGAVTGEMAGLLSVGGDEFIKQDDNKNTNRFKPVVKFLGPFELSEGKTNSHSFTMPNYVGSVKTMVVASHKGAYGSISTTTPVKKPLMVLATLPRMVSPTETVQLPVTVFAMEENVKNVTVEVKTNQMFTIGGAASQKIIFNEAGDRLVNFTLKVAEGIGSGKVEISARSGNQVATDIIDLQVRMPNPGITRTSSGMVEPGKTWDSGYEEVGIRGTNNGVLEVSAVPQMNLDKRLRYLMNYPHGCVEQVTSAVFPQLFLHRFIELGAVQKNEIQENITAGINQLKSFQMSNGGLTYWPGSRNSATEWGTSYAGQFMLEARDLGYKLPAGFLDNWVKYQTSMASSWDRETGYWTVMSNEINQAYRLYTLALAKKPAMGAMNRMREMKDLSAGARWRLAGAYLLSGKEEVAKDLVSGLTSSVEPNSEWSQTFGSLTREQAVILEVMTLLEDKIRAKKLVDELAGKMGGQEWYSTQSTAYTLLAIGKFLGESETAGSVGFEISINGDQKNIRSNAPIVRLELPFEKGNGGNISINNTGDRTLYLSIQLDGVPLISNVKDEENDLRMGIRYLNMEGKVIDPALLEQGTDFMAEVTLLHPGVRGNYQEMALTQMFPSGWEIRNIRMDIADPAQLKDKPDYQDIRDDRVYSYFSLTQRSSKTFIIMLNASYLGDFYLPAVYCEAMYDNSIHATKAGKWVKVVRQE